MASLGEPGSIAELLSQELQSLQAFVGLLHKEQTLLVSGVSEGLTSLAAEKSRTAIALGRLSTARDQGLARIHLPTGRAGMDAWAISNAGVANQRDWDQLLALAAEAKALNEANGKLIALHLQHNQQALSVLLAAADQTATYGPDGQPKQGVGGRSLGSA